MGSIPLCGRRAGEASLSYIIELYPYKSVVVIQYFLVMIFHGSQLVGLDQSINQSINRDGLTNDNDHPSRSVCGSQPVHSGHHSPPWASSVSLATSRNFM